MKGASEEPFKITLSPFLCAGPPLSPSHTHLVLGSEAELALCSLPLQNVVIFCHFIYFPLSFAQTLWFKAITLPSAPTSCEFFVFPFRISPFPLFPPYKLTKFKSRGLLRISLRKTWLRFLQEHREGTLYLLLTLIDDNPQSLHPPALPRDFLLCLNYLEWL